jgi:hypothetical protein
VRFVAVRVKPVYAISSGFSCCARLVVYRCAQRDRTPHPNSDRREQRLIELLPLPAWLRTATDSARDPKNSCHYTACSDNPGNPYAATRGYACADAKWKRHCYQIPAVQDRDSTVRQGLSKALERWTEVEARGYQEQLEYLEGYYRSLKG